MGDFTPDGVLRNSYKVNGQSVTKLIFAVLLVVISVNVY